MMLFQKLTLAAILLSVSGCSANLQHSAKVFLGGGMPVNPTCQTGDIDWTKLQKNDLYLSGFNQNGVKLKEGDTLHYKNNNLETTIRIRKAKENEFKQFSGYVVHYTESNNNTNVIEYSIPITQNLDYQKIVVGMCGGDNARFERMCATEKKQVEDALQRYFYQRSPSIEMLNNYKNALLPSDYSDLESTGKFKVGGQTYDALSKTSYACGLLEGYKNLEREIYQKNISCYRKTGRYCAN